jgi:hypothetical protein
MLLNVIGRETVRDFDGADPSRTIAVHCHWFPALKLAKIPKPEFAVPSADITTDLTA